MMKKRRRRRENRNIEVSGGQTIRDQTKRLDNKRPDNEIRQRDQTKRSDKEILSIEMRLLLRTSWRLENGYLEGTGFDFSNISTCSEHLTQCSLIIT
jgi:hypothetical protein